MVSRVISVIVRTFRLTLPPLLPSSTFPPRINIILRIMLAPDEDREAEMRIIHRHRTSCPSEDLFHLVDVGQRPFDPVHTSSLALKFNDGLYTPRAGGKVKSVGGNRRILRRRRCQPWSLSKTATFSQNKKKFLTQSFLQDKRESEESMEVRHNFLGLDLLPGGSISSSFVVFSFDRIRTQQSTIRSIV